MGFGHCGPEKHNNSNTSSLAAGEMFLTFKIKNRILVQISVSALPSYTILSKLFNLSEHQFLYP